MTSFPAVLQDIAVVVAEDVPAAEVEAAVRAGGGELLAGVRVFDLYRGEQVGEDASRSPCGSSSGRPDRTLTDEEVAERRSGDRARARGDRGAAACLSTAGPSTESRWWAPPASAARSARTSAGATRRSS